MIYVSTQRLKVGCSSATSSATIPNVRRTQSVYVVGLTVAAKPYLNISILRRRVLKQHGFSLFHDNLLQKRGESDSHRDMTQAPRISKSAKATNTPKALKIATSLINKNMSEDDDDSDKASANTGSDHPSNLSPKANIFPHDVHPGIQQFDLLEDDYTLPVLPPVISACLPILLPNDTILDASTAIPHGRMSPQLQVC